MAIWIFYDIIEKVVFECFPRNSFGLLAKANFPLVRFPNFVPSGQNKRKHSQKMCPSLRWQLIKVYQTIVDDDSQVDQAAA